MMLGDLTTSIQQKIDFTHLVIKQFSKDSLVIDEPVIVGTASSYLSGSTTIPRDIDVVIPIDVELNDFKLAYDTCRKYQKSFERVFKKIKSEIPIQPHCLPKQTVTSGWAKFRMTPPPECRGYVLSAFLSPLLLSGLYPGYMGICITRSGETRILSTDPDILSVLREHTNRDIAGSFSSDTLEDLCKSSWTIASHFNCSYDLFREKMLHEMLNLGVKDQVDENIYQCILTSLEKIRENTI